MHDEAEVVRAGGKLDVEVGAVGVITGDEGEAVVEVARVFGGVGEGVDRPVGVVAVGAEVVDAGVSGEQRIGIVDVDGLVVELADSGISPVFVAHGGRVDEFVGPGIFLVAAGRGGIVNDETDVLRAGGDADVKVRPVAVGSADLHGAATVIAGVFGGVEEGVDGPSSVGGIGAVVMDADVTRGDGRIGLGGGWSGCEEAKEKHEEGRRSPAHEAACFIDAHFGVS